MGELVLNSRFRFPQISFLFFFFLFWDLRDSAFGACSPEMIILFGAVRFEMNSFINWILQIIYYFIGR